MNRIAIDQLVRFFLTDTIMLSGFHIALPPVREQGSCL